MGSFKLNMDEAIFDDFGTFGYGVVLCDSSGVVLLAFTEYNPISFDMFTMECKAILNGLILAKLEGFVSVPVEIDCMNLVKACTSMEYDHGPYGNLLHGIKLLLGEGIFSCLSVVRRTSNKVA